MAAQKLTKGRLVQIIVMLVVLLAAFTWRTVTYDNETITCIVSKPCEFGIDNNNVSISGDSQGYSIKTSKTGKFIISYNGNGVLESKGASSWLLQTNDETSSITVTFPQQVMTYTVNLSKE
ncbi:MAG: hypothetical protein VX212_00520 [Pseudomonadota bacterium]|nr:hypothetical protein [Pseudomonadota bacterium]